jgi:pimeloyl-ACP methyl ester carboxylesterase
VVGHSWGAIVAIVLLVGVASLPIIGDILRYTISPLLNWLTMPLVKWALFSPGPVPKRFEEEFLTAMAVRPSQIRATAEDGALMIPGALALRDHYKDLTLPVVIMAGEGDKVVFKRRAEQLKAAVKGSVLQVVQGAGHMVHYQATRQVTEAVETVVNQSSYLPASPVS